MHKHYFRRLTTSDPSVTIQHELGCFPVVDVYELLLINIPGITPAKFYLYYGHDERQALLKAVGERGQVKPGTSIEALLAEYQIKHETDDSMGDVINDFLDAFFVLPNADEMEHLTSSWIDNHRESIVGDLQSRGEWDDIRWFTWPKRIPIPSVDVVQLSYETLQLRAINFPENDHLDVMVVLRD